MKKIIYSLILVFFLYLHGTAQQIKSVVITPSNPTTADTIKIYASCLFLNAQCNPDNINQGQVGNSFYADALHCLGSIIDTCRYTDTIIIAPQPAGTYTFYFILNAGFGGPGCTPSIVPYDYDTSTFTVSTVSGVVTNKQLIKNAFINYNEIGEASVNYTLGKEEKISIVVLDVLGKEIKVITNQNHSAGRHTVPLSLNDLPKGIYFIGIKAASGDLVLKLQHSGI